jgi:hypothetical protein
LREARQFGIFLGYNRGGIHAALLFYYWDNNYCDDMFANNWSNVPIGYCEGTGFSAAAAGAGEHCTFWAISMDRSRWWRAWSG